MLAFARKLFDSIPATEARVPLNTSIVGNQRIRDNMLARIEAIGRDPAKIDARLAELDREWDIERVLEANAAAVALAGVVLGATRSRKWFVVPGLVAGFLLQHAVQGWCPPLPVLRRLGVRTASEIETERLALKALRGDFAGVNTSMEASDLLKLH